MKPFNPYYGVSFISFLSLFYLLCIYYLKDKEDRRGIILTNQLTMYSLPALLFSFILSLPMMIGFILLWSVQ